MEDTKREITTLICGYSYVTLPALKFVRLNCLIAIALFALSGLSLFAQPVLSDTCDVTSGNSSGTGFGANAGVNYQITSRLSGTKSNGVSYVQTATTKAPSSYSITGNKIYVATATGAGRFTFTANGSTPLDFGAALGSTTANPASPVIYELSAKVSNQSPGTERTSIGFAAADNGIQTWNLGIQLVNNGANLDLYRRVDSVSNPSAADYNNVIATLSGKAAAEIDLRIRLTDAGGESGGNFNSRYEVWADGTNVFTSATGDFRFDASARLVLLDTAGGAGPVTYDAISLQLVAATNPPVSTNATLRIVDQLMTGNGLNLSWTSQVGSNYNLLRATSLASSNWILAANVTASAPTTAVTARIDQNIASFFRVAQVTHPGLSVTNVTATRRTGTGLVDIYYDLQDLYSGTASISILISTNGGQTYTLAAAHFSGDVGAEITPGSGRHIVWDMGADGLNLSSVRFQIIADRSPVGPDMALIPTGTFSMGDAMSDGLSSETPVHNVNLSAFYLGRYEVTKGLWNNVFQWATNHGYKFSNPGVGVASNVPVQQINWFDAVKWCNARSEKEGYSPAYFTDLGWTAVYRTGEVNLASSNVRWTGAGYRLPTEAEWEKAARGGLASKRFPFGNTLTQTQVNYWSTDFESFDVNGNPGPHPLAMEFPNVLPVGSFLPSGYGLYDMSGNIWEWCWDYYGDTWYSDGQSSGDDTRGPSSASWGGDRVYRGGSGVDIAWKSRVANRADAPPRFAMGHFGFRVVLPTGASLISAQSGSITLTP